MSVIDIHPEELFDRLTAGTLTESEGERLRGHLATCEVCRFELLARGDFRAELAALPERRPQAPEREAAAVRGTRRVPRSRRALIWVFAASLLLMATGALASVVTGVPPWRLFAETTNDKAQPAAATGVAPARQKSGLPAATRSEFGVAPPAEAPSAEAAAEAPPAEARPAEVPPVEVPPAEAVEAPVAPSPAVRAGARAASISQPGLRSAEQLFADANRARARGETALAVSLYRQLQARHPRSPEAELSQLTLATLLLHRGEARAALAGFDGYLARGARSLQAEALVGRALAQRALGQRELEIGAWQVVAQRFPGTSYARRAEERLVALGRR
jgi:TolA-binding protein